MPPKKEFFKNIANAEDFEPYYQEDYQKLVVIDLYAAWAGPSEPMKDFWKFLNNTPLIEEFSSRCDVLQLESKKTQHFLNYNILSRPKFL